MIKGIYAATSGMVANLRRQMIVANNLANAVTTGYKQDVDVFDDAGAVVPVTNTVSPGSPLSGEIIGEVGTGTELDPIQLDLSQGDIAETGNPLDLAISGPGFFSIQTPSGTLYTRDGTFQVDAMGRLARADGGLVLGQNGPIQVGSENVLIDGDGTVSADGNVVDRIQLVDFDPQQKLLKLGNNYLAPADPNAQATPAAGAAIDQGYLEHSNVDLNRATVDMLSALRSYEAAARLLQIEDQSLDRTVNDIGRV